MLYCKVPDEICCIQYVKVCCTVPDEVCCIELVRVLEYEYDQPMIVRVEQAGRFSPRLGPVGGEVEPPQGRHQPAHTTQRAARHQHPGDRHRHLPTAQELAATDEGIRNDRHLPLRWQY